MSSVRDRLRDLLFGKEVERVFWDNRVGAMTTTVRKPAPGKWCSWRGECVLQGYAQPTYITACGDPQGPRADLLALLHRVLDGLEEIELDVNRAIERQGARGSLANFHLHSIGVWDEVDDVLQLDFHPIGTPILEREVELHWPDDSPNGGHRIVLRGANSWRPRES